MSIASKLLGAASVAASLGAVAFLITSDVAGAGESNAPPPPAQEQAQAQAAPTPAKAPKPKVEKKRKRIDLGRFEGY